MSRDDEMQTTKRSQEEAFIDERLAILAKAFPHLAKGDLMRSKAVIEDSEMLSDRILQGMRQRLAG